MKQLFLLPVLVLLLTGLNIKEETVLICLGSNSYAYHKDYCKGLNQCTREVIKVTKTEAVTKYGMQKACGYCYKK